LQPKGAQDLYVTMLHERWAIQVKYPYVKTTRLRKGFEQPRLLIFSQVRRCIIIVRMQNSAALGDVICTGGISHYVLIAPKASVNQIVIAIAATCALGPIVIDGQFATCVYLRRAAVTATKAVPGSHFL
jgi:hypothetical protein